MKRILNCMLLVTIIFFYVCSILVFYEEKSSNFLADKEKISLSSKYEYGVEEMISRIKQASLEADTDIVFLFYPKEKKEIILFTTGNDSDFLGFGNNVEIDQNIAYSTAPGSKTDEYSWEKIVYPNLFYNYTVYPLNAISNAQLNHAICLTDPSKITVLSEKLNDKFIQIKAEGHFSQKSNNLHIIFLCGLTVLMFLIFFSMIYYQLSESKKSAIKILDGYSFKDFLIDENSSFLLVYSIQYLIVFLLSILFVSVFSGFDLFIMYLRNYGKLILIFSFLTPVLFLLTCLYICFIKPLHAIKGKNGRRILIVLTCFVKYCVLSLIIITLSSNIILFKEYRDEYSIYNNISKNLHDYYCLSIRDVKINEEDYVNFYKRVNKRFNAIMMTAHYCMNPDDEGNIYQWFIYVNDNYMNINPIESINGDIIEFSKLPQNKRTILVPEGKKPEEKIIAEVYSRKLKIEINELNIEYYKDNQKFFIISSMATTKYPGYIKSPIVIIHNLNDNVTGAISTKELIFQAHTSDFNSEIMPYLQEYGIEFSTASSVSAGDDILEVLNQKLIEMLVVFTSNIFLILILFITIMYETWIYFENNRKLFVLKKIEGFSFINIHKTQIVCKTLLSAILIFFTCSTHSNFIVPLVMIFMDYIIFYGKLESKTVKYSAQILKGE